MYLNKIDVTSAKFDSVQSKEIQHMVVAQHSRNVVFWNHELHDTQFRPSLVLLGPS